MTTFVIFVGSVLSLIIAYSCPIRNRLFMGNDILDSSGSAFLDLVRGKWEQSSLEMLLTLATRVGLHVSLKTTA